MFYMKRRNAPTEVHLALYICTHLTTEGNWQADMPWGIMLVPVGICTSVIPGVDTDFASVGDDILQL